MMSIRMNITQATKAGFRPLTVPLYQGEEWILKNVVGDMKRGKIEYVLVDEEGGWSVWRK